MTAESGAQVLGARSLIIGIDASRALAVQPTGTERYALEIIRHLLALPEAAAHSWRLYAPEGIAPEHPLRAGAVGAAGAVESCVLPPARAWTHRRLGAAVAAEPPDVLFVPAHVLPVGRALPPSVVTLHDCGYLHLPEAHTRSQRFYLDWTTRDAVRRATRVIAVSEATAADLRAAYGADAARLRVIHEAAPVAPTVTAGDAARVRVEYGLTRPYALFVGTLQPRKNVVRLAQAYARLAAAGQADFDLVLAGKPGWKSEPLLAEIEALRAQGLGAALRLPGYVPAADAPALLRGAFCFCYPSLFEGFGLPILEAQEAGVPVLTANNSSLPEVAGEGALLVDPTDVEALADALLQLSRDPALRARLIDAGHANVKRFSWEKAARATLAVLEEAAHTRFQG